MANATVAPIGQINGAGATDALFLKVFGGEVLSAFEETNVMSDKHTVRTISSGKSASFPATWKVSAAYHTAGAEIVGQATKQNERVITIDDLLVADVFISNIDEAKNHYDFRSIYTTECGRALANQQDANLLQVGLNAARAAATITGGNGGAALTGATFGTDASVLAGGMFDAMQNFDEKDVPEAERYMFVKPAQYYLLAQSTNVINRDWGGSGAYSEGEVLKVAGLHIVKTNNVPQANIATGPTAYQGNFSTTIALAMQKQAIGTVKLMDLAVEAGYDMRRQGTLVLAKYALGHGILRPECAVEFKTA